MSCSTFQFKIVFERGMSVVAANIKMSQNKSPLIFNIVTECKTTKARVAKMILPHGEVDTPVFMPVGTQVNTKLT